MSRKRHAAQARAASRLEHPDGTCCRHDAAIMPRCCWRQRAWRESTSLTSFPPTRTWRGVSDGVLTVTHNALGRAFDFFARELPMPDVGEQED